MSWIFPWMGLAWEETGRTFYFNGNINFWWRFAHTTCSGCIVIKGGCKQSELLFLQYLCSTELKPFFCLLLWGVKCTAFKLNSCLNFSPNFYCIQNYDVCKITELIILAELCKFLEVCQFWAEISISLPMFEIRIQLFLMKV